MPPAVRTSASWTRAPATTTRSRSTTHPFRFDSPQHFVEHFETRYGPMLKARERLSAEGSWQECRREIIALAERRNEAVDDAVAVRFEYLVAVRRTRSTPSGP